MVRNDIAIDTGETDAAANSGYAANHIPADGKSAHATNAAALDKRITRLETKLLDNQRDLHTLLQKIREISRLQVNSGQSHKKLANDDAETMVIDEAKDEAVAHRSQRSPVIMVAMAVLIGLGAGITYFLATGEGDPSALKRQAGFQQSLTVLIGGLGKLVWPNIVFHLHHRANRTGCFCHS